LKYLIKENIMASTRRNFIKQSLATAAGLGLADSFIPQRAVSANDTLAVGLIGCKNMGFADLQDFLKCPGIVCTALCDVDDSILNERAADVEKLTGAKPALFKDFRQVLEDKHIDAVIIGTPDHWHCLQLVMACEAGKDVYVEKPLANSIAECQVMLKAARKYNRVVQVGQQQRSGQHWADVIQLVQSGKLGTLRRIQIWANFNYASGQPAVPDEAVPAGVDFNMWLGPAPQRTFNRNRFHGWWRMFWDYGGGLMSDWGVHLLDMGIWAKNITAAPKSVMAAGGLFASQGHAVETADTQSVLYQFDDFIMTWEHNAGIQSGPYGRCYGVAFIGTNGTAVVDRERWEVYGEDGQDGKRMESIPQQPADREDHIKHVKNFIECVKSRQKPACDIEIGYRAALFAHMGNIAYRSGEKLMWDESTGLFIDAPTANTLIRPVYRAPWKFPQV
jgi:predicted dehydrogenase